MKHKMKAAITNGFLLAMMILAAWQSEVEAQMIAGGGRIVGTWDTVVTIKDCDTGAPIRSFLSTGTFNQGGTFAGITAGTPPTLRTSELGVWKHVNANLYRFTFKAYLYNPAGQATAYQIITHDVELHANNLEYSSSGTTEIYTLDGVQVGAGCSDAVATRMTLDE